MPGQMPIGGRFISAAPQGSRYPNSGSRIIGTPLVMLLSTLSLTKGSPFYDMLATFVAATAGLAPVFDDEHYPAFLEGVGGVYKGFRWPTMTVDLGASVKDFRRGMLDRVTAENSLCCMLANAAWESTPFATNSQHRYWRNPEVQFLRHVRHAASHGNRWKFQDPSKKSQGTPILPAVFSDLAIDHTKRGSTNPLHGQQCFGHSLGSADLLRLLLNVEALLT